MGLADTPNFYLVANPIGRYSIGDRTPELHTGDDGSLTIFMQKEEPDSPEERANWLPTPDGLGSIRVHDEPRCELGGEDITSVAHASVEAVEVLLRQRTASLLHAFPADVASGEPWESRYVRKDDSGGLGRSALTDELSGRDYRDCTGFVLGSDGMLWSLIRSTTPRRGNERAA